MVIKEWDRNFDMVSDSILSTQITFYISQADCCRLLLHLLRVGYSTQPPAYSLPHARSCIYYVALCVNGSTFRVKSKERAVVPLITELIAGWAQTYRFHRSNNKTARLVLLRYMEILAGFGEWREKLSESCSILSEGRVKIMAVGGRVVRM